MKIRSKKKQMNKLEAKKQINWKQMKIRNKKADEKLETKRSK